MATSFHPPELLVNQYAYKPTVLLWHLYIFFAVLLGCLKTQPMLGLFWLTLLKLLTSADHTILMSKLADLQLPGNTYNSIGSFLFDR